MFRYAVLSAILFLMASPQGANAQGRWFRYVNGNMVNDAVYHEGDGNVWCATSGGIVRWNPETSDSFCFGYDRGVPGISCTSIIKDAAGVLWAVSGGYLIRLEGSRWIVADEYKSEYPDIDLTLNDIAADSERGLWIATMNGVLRYNGETWILYTVGDGLPYENVKSVAVAPDGGVYAGAVGPAVWKTTAETTQGNNPAGTGKLAGDPSFSSAVTVFEDGAWHIFKELGPTDLSGDLSIAAGSNGSLAAWRRSGYPTLSEGLHWFDGLDWYILNSNNNIPSKGILSAAVSPEGTWWIGTDGGLGRLWKTNDIGFDTFTIDDGLPSNVITAVAFSGDGTLFAGTDHGVARYDGSSWDTFIVPAIAGRYIKHAAVDSTGNVWFGSDNGLSCFGSGGWTTYTVADGLPGNYVNGLTVDSRGRLWVSTTEGVALNDGGHWKSFTANLMTDVAAIWTDDKDRLWIGNERTYSLLRCDGRSLDEINTSRVRASARETNGSFWAVIETGGVLLDLFHYHNDKLEQVKTLGKDNLHIESMTARNGVVWIVLYNRVMRYDGETWSDFTVDDGLPYDPQRIVIDGLARAWCLSETGLSLFQDGSWRLLSDFYGVPKGIKDIHAGQKDTVWFVTEADGLYAYEDGSFVRLVAPEDIPSGNRVHHMFDSQDRFWIGDKSVVSVYDGVELKSYRNPFGIAPWSYGLFIRDTYGRVWFSVLDSGVVRLDPDGTEVASNITLPSAIECLSYPNPFNAATTVCFTLPHDAEISLDIYNIAGQKIRTLADSRMTAGTHTIRWDGSLDSGAEAASGLYIARLKAGATATSVRMLLLR